MTEDTITAYTECTAGILQEKTRFQDREREEADRLITSHERVLLNPDRKTAIRQVIRHREASLGKQGYLYMTTPRESSGRSPLDTYMVRDSHTDSTIDWSSPNNIPMKRAIFSQLWQQALSTLSQQRQLYITDRLVGADPAYALPIRVISDSALTCLFSLNMFRPPSKSAEKSLLAGRPFVLLVLPCHKLDTGNYRHILRTLPDGRVSDMVIVMDFENRLGLVFGSSYGGSVKKLIFTVMNYYLPFIGVLPLHCAASENEDGEIALYLGLSGTGKTSLSSDSKRVLLGDDEHGWSHRGIANFEYGCYAKLIDLDPKKEPEIFRAVFHKDHCLRHGAIVENAMIFSNGTFDLSDDRLTPNSRASYPLTFLRNIKDTGRGIHPRTIVFLTADANSILPPIAKLDKHQAMLWYLMGYTSKLAGTETGILDPLSVFSRFFAQPFMPLLPDYYIRLFGDKLERHHTSVYLLNTGWIGGPFGTGKRIDINLTKHLLYAALNGELEHAPMALDKRFHLKIPQKCQGIPDAILNPLCSWKDRASFSSRADQLAMEFSNHFDKAFGGSNIPREVRMQCPGK